MAMKTSTFQSYHGYRDVKVAFTTNEVYINDKLFFF